MSKDEPAVGGSSCRLFSRFWPLGVGENSEGILVE